VTEDAVAIVIVTIRGIEASLALQDRVTIEIVKGIVIVVGLALTPIFFGFLKKAYLHSGRWAS
jgi:hypothetical protein